MKESFEVEALMWVGEGEALYPQPKALISMESSDNQIKVKIETDRNGTIDFVLGPSRTLAQAKAIATDIAKYPDLMNQKIKEHGLTLA